VGICSRQWLGDEPPQPHQQVHRRRMQVQPEVEAVVAGVVERVREGPGEPDTLIELANGCSPASPESRPAEGSRTSGVPKKSRTCCQAAGILIDRLLGCGQDLTREPVRPVRTAKMPDPP
jgi:hypothetical protein